MLDDFIYKKRFLLGAILIVIIVAGAGLILWDKNRGTKKVQENQEIAELKAQNDLLRQELSQQAPKAVAGESTENESDKININTASSDELDKLPGIGPARAADIIAYRESNGGFKSIDELINIKGIGEKSFEELKNLITVD